MLSPRLYTAILREHLATNRQMAFITGPRQVGKTTVARELADVCFNWDDLAHKRLILAGPQAVAEAAKLGELRPGNRLPVIAFDEIHKHSRWKNWLKGFFDSYEKQCRILVTGSARLDVYKRGGDSMMGRYFLYHMHPLSVGEIAKPSVTEALVRPPVAIPDADWNALLTHGGFPEPFLARNPRTTTRWRNLRLDQLLKEDVRDSSRIQELAQLEVAGHLLSEWSSQQLSFSRLADEVHVSPMTAAKWVNTLAGLHHGFLLRPYFKNIARSLRKEPKWYARDWSGLTDPGARHETLIACHLQKAVDAWTDMGFGTFTLHYLRDTQKREVDFLVVRDKKPWFLVEVKTGRETLSPALGYFQAQTKAPHAFQVVMDLPFVDADCFKTSAPTVVPARTFLSQLP